MNEVTLQAPYFVPNTDDAEHCLQACASMVLSVLMPTQKFSFKELDEMSDKGEGKYTWPLRILVEFAKYGLGVSIIEPFDYVQFSNDPERYLVRQFGEEVGRDQIVNSDLPSVVRAAEVIISHPLIRVTTRIPTKDDIYELLGRGAYIICNVNQRVLQGDPGYVGHFIVIYGANDQGCLIHNPGPPAKKAEVIEWKLFDAAWSYPSDNARNLMGIYKGDNNI